MKRRPLLLLAACITDGLALAGLSLLSYAGREGVVNRVNFERVQPGMTRERVEQLFGGPGERGGVARTVADFIGDLDDRFDRMVYVHSADGQAAVPAPRPDAASASYWRAASPDPPPVYIVVFDRDGYVLNAVGYDARPPGFFARLRDALGF